MLVLLSTLANQKHLLTAQLLVCETRPDSGGRYANQFATNGNFIHIFKPFSFRLMFKL